VRVNHRRRNIIVPQQFLNGAYTRSLLQGMRGKAARRPLTARHANAELDSFPARFIFEIE